jgi:hypothetical protein
MKQHTKYPRWAHRILEWYCSPEFLEEIEGDIFELFERRIQHKRLWIARIQFVWDILRFLRWSNLKKPAYFHPSGQWILFNNYLKLGVRNLYKDIMVNVIRIAGLALALGITITAYIMYDLQVNCDEFHTKADRIYQITPAAIKTNEMKTLGYAPSALGPALKKDFPHIEEIVRIERRGTFAHVGKKSFEENIAFVDPAFFQVFDFPMIHGSRTVLQDKSAMVLSREMALKLFPDQDPIGQEVRVQYGENSYHTFTVKAVLEKYSPYASFQLDYLVAYENLELLFKTTEGWGFHSDATFVLSRDTDFELAAEAQEPYLALHNEAVEDYQALQYRFVPLLDLPENYWNIERALAFSPPAYTRIACLVIAGLLLLMTIFNYINISLGAAGKRIREVGIRKIFGSGKQQIAFQLIVENMVLCFLAFLLGAFLSAYLFTPGLNALLPMDLPFSFSSYGSMILFFLGLFLVIGFISGAYPAFYLSRFPAAHIMKTSGTKAGSSLLSRVLLTFQYVLAFITLIGSIVFSQQTQSFARKDWGYQAENVLMVRAVGLDKARLLKNELSQLSAVQKVAISQGHVGMDNRREKVRYLEKEMEATIYRTEPDYPEVLGLSLQIGIWCDPNLQQPTQVALVNETMVHAMGWKEPLNATLTLNGTEHKVIGVVRDFHYRDFNIAIKPAAFIAISPTDYPLYYVSVKCTPGSLEAIQEKAKLAMETISPDEPFVSKAQVRAFDAFFEETSAGETVLGVISLITLILSSLGIFGLLNFQLQQRIREFSIRKVLGAGPVHLLKKISNRYLGILLIGFGLGVPTGYFLISQLLNAMFAEPFAISWSVYLITLAIILGSIVLAVSGQVARAIQVNPAQNLRNE